MSVGRHEVRKAGRRRAPSARPMSLSMKERRNVKAPMMNFRHRNVGEIVVNKMAATEIGAMAAMTALSGRAMRT